MTKSEALAKECRRLEESCLYTSTSFFIWLRFQRGLRVGFVVLPLVCGSLATWKLLTDSDLESVKLLVALFAFLAGLLPSIYAALKLDDHLAESAAKAAEFKNLQDRFRQAAAVSSQKPFAEFESDFRTLMERFEVARQGSLTPPEWVFQKARKKIKGGDYSFDADNPPKEEA